MNQNSEVSAIVDMCGGDDLVAQVGDLEERGRRAFVPLKDALHLEERMRQGGLEDLRRTHELCEDGTNDDGTNNS